MVQERQKSKLVVRLICAGCMHANAGEWEVVLSVP